MIRKNIKIVVYEMQPLFWFLILNQTKYYFICVPVSDSHKCFTFPCFVFSCIRFIQSLFQEPFHLIRFSFLSFFFFFLWCCIFLLFYNLCLIFQSSTFILIFLLSVCSLLFSVYCFVFCLLVPSLMCYFTWSAYFSLQFVLFPDHVFMPLA